MKKKIKKFFIYIVTFFSDLKGAARAVNEASTPEEMDEMICGGR